LAKHRVAVIGCRDIGIAHAEGLVGLENAALVAGCDLSDQLLGEFKEHWKDHWPDLTLYKDHQEMLARENLDFVTIATSDHLHAELVVNAANAGVRGILCEKPLATTVADCERMLDACERNNTMLSVDHTRRFMPYWRRVKELIEEGTIGPVQNVVGILNHERAMLFRNGTHIIDCMCWFADAKPEWVFGELEAGYEDYSEYRGDGGHLPASEPGAHGYIHFANGVRGIYIGGPKTTPLPKVRFEIVGSNGYITVEAMTGGTRCSLTVDEQTSPVDLGEEGAAAGIGLSVQDVIQAVDEGRPPLCPGKVAKDVVDVMLGILESQRLGNVRVDLPLRA
jgi:predicted dehydrogenase